MKNIFLVALAISSIYVILNLLETKYYKSNLNTNDDDDSNNIKSIKQIIKEGLLVYLSSICGFYVVQQFTPEVEKIIKIESSPLVFVDNPPF